MDPEDNEPVADAQPEEEDDDKSMSSLLSSDTESDNGKQPWLPCKQKSKPEVRLVSREDEDYRQLCKVRVAVFVEEQGVPLESEFIEKEEHLSHNFGLFLDETQCIGTCRLRSIEPFMKLERVAILKEHRGKGYGEILVKHVLEMIKIRWPRVLPAAHAQTSSLDFYRKLGAFVVGPGFLEEGIEHRSITFQWYRRDEDGMREWILCGDPENFADLDAHEGELFDVKVLQKVREIAENIESARIISPMNIIDAVDETKSELGLVYNALRILISRAYAVDEDYFDQNEPSVRATYDEVRKMADHKLNVGNYAEIADHWRLLYAAVEITGSVFFFPNNGSRTKLSTENSYRELSLKTLDSSVLKGRHIFSKRWLKDRVNVLKETLPSPEAYDLPANKADDLPPSLPNSTGVDSIDYKDFDTDEEFTSFVYNNVLGGSKPVLLKNCHGRQSDEMWRHSHLNELLAYRSLPVEVGLKYTDDKWQQMICTGQEFFEMMRNPSAEGPAYMAQYGLQNVVSELEEQIATPDFVRIYAEPENIEINMWIGPGGTISPLHRDPKDNVFVQIVGTKFFRLVSPEDEDKISFQPYGIHKNTSSIDVEKPDLNVHPSFAAATLYDTVVEAGDAIFIPRQWFHHVRSLEPSTSINFWLPIPVDDDDMDGTGSPGSPVYCSTVASTDEEMSNEEETGGSEPEVIEETE